MNDQDAPIMDDDFPVWCKELSVTTDRERLSRRWQGVCSLIEGLGGDDIESLVRIAVRTKPLASSVQLARLREPFKKCDELFEIAGNDREIELLSGATLASIMRSEGDQAAIAALLVTTAGFDGSRVPNLPIDIQVQAENTLDALAVTRRTRPALGRLSANSPPDLAQATARTRTAPFDANAVAEAFTTAGKSIRTAFTSTFESIEGVYQYIGVQDEELQMLWWLIGERSQSLDKTFSSIDQKARPLILSRELATMTTVLPGPRSLKALLQRTGGRWQSKIDVPTAINACPIEWLRSVSRESTDPSPATSPVLFAIKRKLETEDDSVWIDNWAAVTGIARDFELPAIVLGTLFYRECLYADEREEHDRAG